MASEGDMEPREASLSSALAVIFRGKLCVVVLRNRPVTTFEKDQVLYNGGDKDQTLFFLRSGFAKVGTITLDGIYDVRKGGDVVGELCASENPRQDHAVAFEQTQAIAAELIEAHIGRKQL